MKNYRPVAAVVVQRGDRWLLVRKPRQNHAWQFPQGGVEAGENFVEAAARELAEECGDALQVKISPEPVAEYRYDFPVGFIRHHGEWNGAAVKFFRAVWQSGEPQSDGVELVETRWCTMDEIRQSVDQAYWQVVRPICSLDG